MNNEPVDVLRWLQNAEAMNGRQGASRERVIEVISELIEASQALERKAVQRTRLTASVYTAHVMRVRHALAAIKGASNDG